MELFEDLLAIYSASGGNTAEESAAETATAIQKEILFGGKLIGEVFWYDKNLTGTPALPSNFVELNGQTISDIESPYNGVTMRNINGDKRFIRGGAMSGVLQADALQGHKHQQGMPPSGFNNSNNPVSGSGASTNRTMTTTGPVSDGTNGTPRLANETRSINISMVACMRIK